MILPVICFTPELATRSRALIDYCRALDGTQVIPIEMRTPRYADKMPKDSLASLIFHYAATLLDGYVFFWLEHDSVPLKPGWLWEAELDYLRSHKPYMLTSDSHPPHDLIGGIGVYGPSASLEIPCTFKNNAWDLWMLENIPEKIHRSALIQHSYGIYGEDGHVKQWHEFPRDNSILRRDAVIFHKDPTQSLMRR